ncbi:MAG: hypothetical protein ACFCBW_12680 [Candidatus Competibacterales bacterium]
MWGVYDYRFVRVDSQWRITHFGLDVSHQRGNSAVRTATRPVDD